MQSEKQRKSNKEKQQSLREMWDSIKCTNIYLMGVLKREEGDKIEEKVFKELMAEYL